MAAVVGHCLGAKNCFDDLSNAALKTNWYFLASATDRSQEAKESWSISNRSSSDFCMNND